MRRAAVSLIAAALTVLPAAPARAAEALSASARASVLFAQLEVQPSFDPAFADSRSSSSSIGTTSLQSVVWPSFLVDAFFFLYGFQSVERLALGIAEARWPQGPTEVDATQSNVLFLNGGDPNALPGKGGRSVARAGEGTASGDVAWGSIALGGMGELAGARSDTRVSTDGVATSIARQEVSGLSIGPLQIDLVRGEARTSSAGEADASLEILGARIAGQSVVLDDDGARAASDQAQAIVDAALAGSGMKVETLPKAEHAAGSEARASSGGLLIRIDGEGPDPTGGTQSIGIGFIVGAADAASRAVSIEAPRPIAPDEPVIHEGVETCICAAPLPPPVDGSVDTQLVRRTIITTVATGVPIGARGAYGAVMLAGFGLLLVRPLVRAAARS